MTNENYPKFKTLQINSRNLIEFGMILSLIIVNLLSTELLSNIFILIMGIIFLIMLIAVILKGRFPSLSKTTVYFFVLVAMFVLSTLVSMDRSASLQYSAYFIIFLFIAYVSTLTNSWMDNFIKYSFLFSLVHMTITLLSAIFPNLYISIILPLYSTSQQNNILYWMNNNTYPGIAGQIGTNAFLISIGIAIVYVKFLSKKSVKNTFILVLFMIALFLTGKRGLLLGNVIAFIVIYYFGPLKSNIRKIYKLIGFTIVTIMVIYISSLFIPSLATSLSRFTTNIGGEDFSSGRLDLYKEAFIVFKQYYLTGTGINSYVTLNFGSIDTSLGVHNDYIQILVELGIFGFLIYFLPIISVFMYTVKKIKSMHKNKEYTKYYNYLMFSFYFQTIFLVYAITGNPFHYINSLLYYFLVISIPLYFEGGNRFESRNINIS